ncbi:MAG TPA: hypothetical protein VG895_02530 [Patescibacteria group bacterium]|nr:hypothetical protein [Patescibacteria group bacterium]
MPERFIKSSDILPVKKLREAVPIVILSFSLAFAPQVTNAQDTDTCFKNGYVNVPTCDHIFKISNEIINKGYYDFLGCFEKSLPSYQMTHLSLGYNLKGKTLRMDNDYANYMKGLEAARIGKDPNIFTGVIAGPDVYLGSAAWIEDIDTKIIQGPVLQSDEIADFDWRARLYHFNSAFEVDTTTYQNLDPSATGAENTNIIYQDIDNISKPDFDNIVYVDYASVWLDKDGYNCPY